MEEEDDFNIYEDDVEEEDEYNIDDEVGEYGYGNMAEAAAQPRADHARMHRGVQTRNLQEPTPAAAVMQEALIDMEHPNTSDDGERERRESSQSTEEYDAANEEEKRLIMDLENKGPASQIVRAGIVYARQRRQRQQEDRDVCSQFKRDNALDRKTILIRRLENVDDTLEALLVNMLEESSGRGGSNEVKYLL